MNTANKKSRVSVIEINNALGKLTGRNKLAVLDFQSYWNNGTGYFDGLVNTSPEVLGVAEGEVAMAMDPHGRFILIGVLSGQVCVVFQRYEVEAGKHNTTIILQLQNEDTNPMGKILGETHGPIYFEDLLTFLRQFPINGGPIADSLHARLSVHISDEQLAAGVGVPAAIPTTAETNSTDTKENTVSNQNANTNDNTAAGQNDAADNADKIKSAETVTDAGATDSATAAGAAAGAAAGEAAGAVAGAAAAAATTASDKLAEARDFLRSRVKVSKRDAAFFGGGLAVGILGTLAVKAVLSSDN